MDQTQQEAIEQFVIQAARAAHVHITQVKLLSGGAVQENWLLDLSIEGGPHQGNLEAVLRCDSPTSGVAISHGRAQEFALLNTVFDAGVTVPQPLWLCEDLSVFGRPFF